MNKQDALFNWLQMELVCKARPTDMAAVDTLEFFRKILNEDHQMSRVEIDDSNEEVYEVRYWVDGLGSVQRFDRERADKLLNDINSNPKYNQ